MVGELNGNVLTVNIVGWLRIPLGVVLNVGVQIRSLRRRPVSKEMGTQRTFFARIVLMLHVRPGGSHDRQIEASRDRIC